MLHLFQARFCVRMNETSKLIIVIIDVTGRSDSKTVVNVKQAYFRWSLWGYHQFIVDNIKVRHHKRIDIMRLWFPIDFNMKRAPQTSPTDKCCVSFSLNANNPFYFEQLKRAFLTTILIQNRFDVVDKISGVCCVQCFRFIVSAGE